MSIKKIALGFATTVGLITGSAYLFAPAPPDIPEQQPLPMPQATVEEYSPPADITEEYTPSVPVDENEEAEVVPSNDVKPTQVEEKPVGWIKRTVRRITKKEPTASKPTVSKPRPKQTATVKKKGYTNIQYAQLPRIKKQNRIRASDNRTIFVEGINADFGRY